MLPTLLIRCVYCYINANKRALAFIKFAHFSVTKQSQYLFIFQASNGTADSANNKQHPQPAAVPVQPKPEQKPVECNLCHRKFKNVPALNGHMRLHGGYFKKVSSFIGVRTRSNFVNQTQCYLIYTSHVHVFGRTFQYGLLNEKMFNIKCSANNIISYKNIFSCEFLHEYEYI